MRVTACLLLVSLLLISGKLSKLSSASSLHNGEVWHDTAGNQIEAHGGGMMKLGTVYHWWGSGKKEITGPSGKHCTFECSLDINLYTSKDLVNWDFVAVVFNATSIELANFPARFGYTPVKPFRIERPKVIYNAATKLFVLVFHCEDAPYGVGGRGVATSAAPEGPFAWVGASRADNMFSMDMTEFVDPNDNGKAYHIRTAKFKGTPNDQWTVGSPLSGDYLNTAGVCFNTSTHTEGVAMIFHAGSYYLFGSHLTGLAANAARVLRCTAPKLSGCCTNATGPGLWEDLGNPAVGPAKTPEGAGPSLTFNSQSTFVLPLTTLTSSSADRDAERVVALWMGDRWNPDPNTTPGGEHNSTYVWGNLRASSKPGEPPLTFGWEEEITPGRLTGKT